MITPDEIARLRAAHTQIVRDWPEVERALNGYATLGSVHGVRYAGPSIHFGQLIADFGTLLDALEAGKPTRAQMAETLTQEHYGQFPCSKHAEAHYCPNCGRKLSADGILDALAAAGYLREARTEEGR